MYRNNDHRFRAFEKTSVDSETFKTIVANVLYTAVDYFLSILIQIWSLPTTVIEGRNAIIRSTSSFVTWRNEKHAVPGSVDLQQCIDCAKRGELAFHITYKWFS